MRDPRIRGFLGFRELGAAVGAAWIFCVMQMKVWVKGSIFAFGFTGKDEILKKLMVVKVWSKVDFWGQNVPKMTPKIDLPPTLTSIHSFNISSF